MTTVEMNAYASVPRIAKELKLISTLLRTIAVIEYANAIDCSDIGGRIQRTLVLEKVREDLGIAAE